MAGSFELRKSSNGQYSFVLRAGNRQVILTSEQYESRAAAVKGIESVQANCANDARYERKVSADGKPFFALKAANYQVIGMSQMYSGVRSRERGIASVKANGASTVVKDNT